jgi:hypothetical protein
MLWLKSIGESNDHRCTENFHISFYFPDDDGHALPAVTPAFLANQTETSRVSVDGRELFNLSHCFRSCLAKSHNRPDPWVTADESGARRSDNSQI